MKVGILTFSAAHNFGAILQCYGLYKTIEDMGHDVEVIDYCPDYLSPYMPVWGWRHVINRHIFSLKNRYSIYKYWRSIYDGYISFKKDNLRMTPRLGSSAEIAGIAQQYDAIMIGSDQIWNSRFNGQENIWYGEGLKNRKIISYAASAGNIAKWLDDAAHLKHLLSNFTSISARESELAKAIDNLNINKKSTATTVLDPSLLADNAHWMKWTKPIDNSNYIIVYQARESDDIFRIAESLKSQINCDKIITLDFYGNVERLGYETLIATPEDFVSLIANARCVVTTSFHGTAFSIILKTPFYTLRLNDGADGRSECLLKELGLNERLIDADTSPVFSEIDFSDAHRKLSDLRKHSLEFIKTALS